MKQILGKVKDWQWFKSPVFWARFMAYAIPLGFLLYVLYMNFLPFGYNKTFTIDVGSENDTTVGEFYLEPSRDLSERKTGTDASGNQYTYRELNGVAYAIFKPNAVLKDAEVTVSVEGEGVSIIPPVIDFNPDSVEWDYSWDFSSSTLPSDLIGTTFPFDGCAYFDGKSKLELPNSQDEFEDGPFSVYVEWTPQNSEDNFQQIVGHYNWELLQNKDSVSFQVGRMNDAEGEFYSVEHPVEPDFFNKKHTMLAIYSPELGISGKGYISLFIDNGLIQTVFIENKKIFNGYGNKNLTLGKAGHGTAKYFKGCINSSRVVNVNLLSFVKKFKVRDAAQNQLEIILLSSSSPTLNFLRLNAIKK
jgi:hypothetical protein